jgi:hypothetical protein
MFLAASLNLRKLEKAFSRVDIPDKISDLVADQSLETYN